MSANFEGVSRDARTIRSSLFSFLGVYHLSVENNRTGSAAGGSWSHGFSPWPVPPVLQCWFNKQEVI
jgi:hypothetical protein